MVSKEKEIENLNKGSESYTAKDIYVLEGLDPVRKRPGMYIGSTGVSGLHHLIWEIFDNSLTYNVPVMIKENGNIRMEKIGKLVDGYIGGNLHLTDIKKTTEILRSNFNIETLSFNPVTYNLSWTPISSLIRHRVNSEILEVTLQNNRKIEITPFHSLFTFSDGGVKAIKGNELKEGSYVIVPKKYAETEEYITKIDLVAELLKLDPELTSQINLYGVKPLLTKEYGPFIKEYFKDNRRCLEWGNMFYDYKRFDYLPFNIFRTFSLEMQSKFADCKIGNKNNKHFYIPRELKIDKNLVELLGLYTAEGSNLESAGHTRRVVFSFGSHEKELITYTQNLIKKVFNYDSIIHYAHESANTIQMDSIIISIIFNNILHAGNNSHHKWVPNIIFNVSRDLRERYLVAYLSGDGYPTSFFSNHLFNNTSPTIQNKDKYSLASASKDLVEDLSYLLFTLNKTFSIGETHSKNPHRGTQVNYHGKITNAVMPSETHSFRIDFYWNTEKSYMNRLPFNSIINSCASEDLMRTYSTKYTGITTEKALKLAEEQSIVLKPEAIKFLNSDLGILKVKSIKVKEYTHPWVYDVSVPNGENFVGGYAPMIVHNSIDEALAGYCRHIGVDLLPNNRVAVLDDGRGIPVDLHPQTKKSALETALTVLHAGGKFGGESYKISGGLHGVGVSVVNALSKYMRAEVYRDGVTYSQEYKQGKPVTKLEKEKDKEKRRGTMIMFDPDPEIFKEINFDWKTILSHLREQAYLTKQIHVTVKDLRDKDNEKKYLFYFSSGLVAFLQFLLFDRESKSLQKQLFYTNDTYEGMQVEVALAYTDDIESMEVSFANNIKTPEGGMHLTGFRTALTRVLNDYAKSHSKDSKEVVALTGDDVREGLIALVSVKLHEPQFEGQTKAKLGNPEARIAVDQIMSKSFRDFLEKNPEDAKRILEKGMLSARARNAAKAARDNVLRKSVFETATLPGKLADCISNKASESELFIVEGESAGGCFSGDTQVALVDGRNVSFIDLIKEQKEGKKNYCYTIKEDGSVGIAPILNARKTKTEAEVIKVTLDNNEELICTPDHKFMVNDLNYIEAINLTESNLLKIKEGNEIKIQKIKNINELIDVYDIEVPETHNFALSCGIFVHNSGKQGRDRNTQAILPLRGKILNVEKARLDRMFASEEIKAVILALGTAISENFNLDKLRYHKIILMSDADVDGAHIRTLLLTLFYRYFRPLVDNGHIYIAQPPLYRIQKGKEVYYVYNDEQKENILKNLGATVIAKEEKKEKGKIKINVIDEEAQENQVVETEEETEGNIKGVSIQRYKGLGEMNPDQLWETTMDPKSRVLLRITVEDAEEADKLFSILMGDDVLPRKKFIEAYAKKVKNLDI